MDRARETASALARVALAAPAELRERLETALTTAGDPLLELLGELERIEDDAPALVRFVGAHRADVPALLVLEACWTGRVEDPVRAAANLHETAGRLLAEAERRLTHPPVALTVLPGVLAMARLEAGAELPAWAATPAGPCWTVTRTADELSVLTTDDAVPSEHPEALRGLRALVATGPLDPELTGVLAGITGTLAAAGVWLLAVCTYDTDYVLVRQARLEDAVAALRAAGHPVDR